MYNKIIEVCDDIHAIGDIADMLRTSDIVQDGCVDPSTIQNICRLTAHVMWHIADDLDGLNLEMKEQEKKGVRL